MTTILSHLFQKQATTTSTQRVSPPCLRIVFFIFVLLVAVATVSIDGISIDLSTQGGQYTLENINDANAEYELWGSLSGTPCKFTLRNIYAKNINVSASFATSGCVIVADNVKIREGTLSFHGGAMDAVDATFSNLDMTQDDSTNAHGAFNFQPVACPNCKVHVSNSVFSRTYNKNAAGAYDQKHPAKCSNQSYTAWTVCIRPVETLTVFNNSFAIHGFGSNYAVALYMRGIHPVNVMDKLLIYKNSFKASSVKTGSFFSTKYYVSIYGHRVELVKLRAVEIIENDYDFGGCDKAYPAVVWDLNRTEYISVYRNTFKGTSGVSDSAYKGPYQYSFMAQEVNFTDEDGTGNGKRADGTTPMQGNITVVNNSFDMQGKYAYGPRVSFKLQGLHYYTCTDNHFTMYQTASSGHSSAISGMPKGVKYQTYIAHNYCSARFYYFINFLYHWGAEEGEIMNHMLVEHNYFSAVPISKSQAYHYYFLQFADSKFKSKLTGTFELRHNTATGGGSVAYTLFAFMTQLQLNVVNMTNNTFSITNAFSDEFTTAYSYYVQFLRLEANVSHLVLDRNVYYNDCKFKSRMDTFLEFSNSESKRDTEMEMAYVDKAMISYNQMTSRGDGRVVKFSGHSMAVLVDVTFDNNTLDASDYLPYKSSTSSEYGFFWNSKDSKVDQRYQKLVITRNWAVIRTQYKLYWFYTLFDSELKYLEMSHNTFIGVMRYPGSSYIFAYSSLIYVDEINGLTKDSHTTTTRYGEYTPTQGIINVSHNVLDLTVYYGRFVYLTEDTLLLALIIHNNYIRLNSSTTSSIYGALFQTGTSSIYPCIVLNLTITENFVQFVDSRPLRLIYASQLNVLDWSNISFNFVNASVPRSPAHATSSSTTYRSGDYAFHLEPASSSSYKEQHLCRGGCLVASNTVLGPYRYIFYIGGYFWGDFVIRNNTAQFTNVSDTIMESCYFVETAAETKLFDGVSIIVQDNFWNTTLSVKSGTTTHARHAQFMLLGADLFFHKPESAVRIRNNRIYAYNATTFCVFQSADNIRCSASSAALTPSNAPVLSIADNSVDTSIYAAVTVVSVLKYIEMCKFGALRIERNTIAVSTFKSQEAAYLSRRSIALVTMDSYIVGGPYLNATSASYRAQPPNASQSQLVVAGNRLTWAEDPAMSSLGVAELSLLYHDDAANGPGGGTYRFVGTVENNSIAMSQKVVEQGPAALAAKVTPQSSFLLVKNSSANNSLKATTLYIEDNTIDALGAMTGGPRYLSRYALGNPDADHKYSSGDLQMFVGPRCNAVVQIDAESGAEKEATMSAVIFKHQMTGGPVVLPPDCGSKTKSLTPRRTRSNSSEVTVSAEITGETPTETATLTATASESERLTRSDEPNVWGKVVNTRSISASISATIRTRSDTRSISPIPPIATVGLSLEEKAEAATQAAAISMAASFAAPSAAMVAMRIVAVFDLMGCPEVNGERQSWNKAMLKYPATLPIFQGVGFGSDEGRYARGAVVGFILVIMLCAGLALLGGVVLEMKRIKTLKEEHEKLVEKRRLDRHLLQQRASDIYNNMDDALLLDDDELLSDTSSERRMRVPERSLLVGAMRCAPMPWLVYMALCQTFFFWAVAVGMVLGLLQPKDFALGLLPLFGVLAIVGVFHYRVVDRVLFSKQGPRVTRSMIYYPKGTGEAKRKVGGCLMHPVVRSLFMGFYTYQLPRLKNLSERELRNTYLVDGVPVGGGGSGSSSDDDSSSSSDDDFANDLEDADELEDILRKRQETVDLVGACRGILTKFWAPLHRRELQTLEEEARMDLGMQTSRQRSAVMTLAEEHMEEEEEKINEHCLLRCVHRETVMWKLRARFCPHFMFIQCVLAAIVGISMGFGRTGPAKYCKKAARAVAFFNFCAWIIIVVLRPYIIPSLNAVFVIMETVGMVCSLIGVFLIQEGRMPKESAGAVEHTIIYTVMIGSTLAGVISGVRVFVGVALKMPMVPRVEIFRRVRSDLEDVTVVAGGMGALGLFAEALF